MVAPKAPENFSLAHVAPLPAHAVEHPNTILEPKLLTLHLTLTLTLTLIKIEYWDRAGGGGNMSYDW